MNRNEIVLKDMKYIHKSIDVEKLKNKNILITGITGMLASYLVFFFDYLNKTVDSNIHIIGLARNKEKVKNIFNDINIEVLNQDICQPVVYDGEIDYIFHFASSANPNTIVNDPVSIIKSNTIGTLNIFELAKQKNAKVIFSSTREVYGKVEGKEQISEKDMGIVECFDGRACYPESKRIAETICKSYQLEYGVNFNILRIAHVYGPGMNIINDGRIMSDIIGDIVRSNNVVLKSLGQAKRAFCYISDAILGILYVVIHGNENEVYNISNESEEIKIVDLVELAIKASGKNIKIEYKISDGKGYTNYKRVGLDNKKLMLLGWSPKVSLEEGIKNTLASFMCVE